MKENSVEENLLEFFTTTHEELEEALETNLTMRMKFPSEIEKFYPSEEKINNLLTSFESKLEETEQTAYEILTALVNSKVLISLLKTLEHPNLDINISSVNCFHSLTVDMAQEIESEDKDPQGQGRGEEGEEGEGRGEEGKVEEAFAVFFRGNVWMVENGMLESLFRVLSRANEENIEEYECCRKVLKIIEHTIELCDNAFEGLIKETQIIKFLANRIMPNFTVSHRLIDDNKYIASDVLLSLLQTPEIPETESAVRQLFSHFGTEILIETLSAYENNKPTEIAEREFVSNLFDCLNMLMVSIKESRPQFHQMKGSYLMVGYICAKSEYAINALKVVANSLDPEAGEEENAKICEEIVNDGSLKYLFPILMRQGLKSNEEEEQEEIYENVLRILLFLLQFSQGQAKDRVIYKFIEKNYQKMEKLFEIRVEYNRVEEEGEITAEKYIELIKSGSLSIVELCDNLILTLWQLHKGTHKRLLQLLPLYNIKPSELNQTIERQYSFIDDGTSKGHLAKLIAGPLRELQDIRQQGQQGEHGQEGEE